MATVELGTFLFFAIVPFLAIPFAKAFKSWGLPGMVLAGAVGLLGFIMLSAMALFMFSEYDIVTTKVHAEYQTINLEYNGTGALISNSTMTIPERTETNPIINSNHYEIGWILSGLAIALGLIYFKVISSG